ncbi:hypothetical protein QZH41_000073 [Actinostola sp. cb2023]|nr:hypothetical protein QZH41_000073 [Actinostola sp. cb2023]
MSLGDIEKLSEKDVQQFHTRYEVVLAQKMRKNDRWRGATTFKYGRSDIVTSPPPATDQPAHVKDPKKAAGGLRVAAKNKEARAALAREQAREQQTEPTSGSSETAALQAGDVDTTSDSESWSTNTLLVIGGLAIDAGGLYLQYKQRQALQASRPTHEEPTAAVRAPLRPAGPPMAWLSKQALWQIYLPPPRHLPRPRFDVSEPNEVHQADLLFLPHDRPGRGQKLYKYALTIVDVASRYKEAEPLATKEAKEVAATLERIYKRSPLTWPKLLQVDPGREFMGAVGPLLAKHGVSVRRGRVDIHRDQAIVERFNRTLSERLFGHQYAQEMLLQSQGDSQRSVEWVNRLPAVVAALNGEVTRLIVSEKLKNPEDAIKAESVTHKPPSVVSGCLVGLKEQRLPSDVGVRYLYAPGELEGGRKRATDPVWSLQVYRLGRSVTKTEQPVLYYLLDGPERGFVREELLVVPPDTQLPPDGVLK